MKTLELIEAYQRSHGTDSADELYKAVNTLSEMGLVSKAQADSLRETRYNIARKNIDQEARRTAGRIRDAAHEYSAGGKSAEDFIFCVKTFLTVYEESRNREFQNIGF